MDINYFKFGEGTKIIAIIPGVSLGNIISLRNSIEAEYDIFKKDYTLYVFDRYHSLKRGYTIDDMAYDMINAFDELCLKDINVISTSQGGQIAQVVAIKRPDLIKKLVLFSTTPIITDEKYDLFMHWVGEAKPGNEKKLIETFSRDVYSKDFYEKYKLAFLMMADKTSSEDLDKFIISCKAMRNFDVVSDLKKIRCETLIIAGSNDVIFEPFYANLIGSEVGVKPLIFEGESHALYDENPKYLKMVLDFFNK